MLKKLAYVNLIIAPFLSNYVFYGALSFGDISIFLFLLFILMGGEFESSFVRKFKSLALVAAFSVYCVSMIFLWGSESISGGFYRLFFYLLILLLVPVIKWDGHQFLGCAEYIGRLFSVSLLAQFILYHIGYIVVLRFPMEQYEIDALEIVDHIYRGGGWFREPSYFALFLLPVIVYQARVSKWYGFLLSALALVASTSSLAFIAFAAIVCDQLIRRGKKPSSWVVFLIAANLMALLFIFFKDFTFVSRIIEIGSGGGSFAFRVLPFFEYMDEVISLLPSPHSANPILSLTESGEVWFSSVFYMATLFGLNVFVFLLVGLVYLGWFYGFLFLILLFATSIASTAFSAYIGIAFYCLKLMSSEYKFNIRINGVRSHIVNRHSL